MYGTLLFLLTLPNGTDPSKVTEHIDATMTRYWQDNEVQPAAPTDDASFLRRVTLDLCGRIPTTNEAKAFLTDKSPTKRIDVIRRLMRSPEYPLHMGRVLDDILQAERAGDKAFVEYLRNSVAENRSWDRIFREVMVGPYNNDATKGAERYLSQRIKNLDAMTVDTSNSFFGVNISCAQCHDHPLVPDWKQDHFYGMASFFVRSQGTKLNKGKLLDKSKGEVTFTTTKGERKTGKLMFLSNEVIEEPKEKLETRRVLLVEAALTDKTFFSRAIVNQLWAYFLGRGLVHPVDQIHSSNPPAVAGLLEWLGDDFANNGYNLHRFVEALLASRVYQLSSESDPDAEAPLPDLFVQAPLRPLTPRQFAFSLVLGTREEGYDKQSDPEAREKEYRTLEEQAVQLVSSKNLDRRSDRYQASAGEALYMSNHADVQQLVSPVGKNLTARLSAMDDPEDIVDTVLWTLMSRPPRPAERTFLVAWLRERDEDRSAACSQLVWAFVTSAEFRFNY